MTALLARYWWVVAIAALLALLGAEYGRWLPLINHENRQCGLLAAKALMLAGGVIACDAPRHPLPPLHPTCNLCVASPAYIGETASL